jgi:inner membrane protein
VPSPVGHALAGLIVHLLTARDRADVASLRHAAVAVTAAVAPDLDLLLRFVDGRNHHQGASHSITYALLAGGAVALAGRAAGWPRSLGLGIAAAAGWGSHLLLDYFGQDTHPPIGIPLLWPFSGGYFNSPWALFLDIGRTLDWHTVRHDALAVSWEMVFMLPVLLATWWLRWRRREG